MTEPRTTRHLVDPELLPVLEVLPDFRLSAETLGPIREGAGMPQMPRAEPPIAADVRTISGPAGSLEVFWFDPAPGSRRRPALLHIHGGGMVLGSARDMQLGPSTLAANLGVPVASVEYRLAPETPFPGPQEDCLAALRWLAEEADALGVDRTRIALIGESAGGGLAAAVAQMARDCGGPMPCGQVLTYPMLDHRTGSDDCPYRNRHTGEFVWSRENNRFGWASLRGSYEPVDPRKGWFSPSLADDLTGLPPTWIGVGNLDLFFDEDLDYARRLVDAGVPVELHAYPGAFHGFNMLGTSRVAQAFARDMLGGIERLLGPER